MALAPRTPAAHDRNPDDGNGCRVACVRAHRSSTVRFGRTQSGFSLVELAVVLVVIGLIMAAFSIGRDLHRGAVGLQAYAKHVQPWAVAYNEYFARAKVVVGDNIPPPGTPTLKVAAASDTRLCDTPAPTDGVGTLNTLMQSVGIEMPPGRAEGKESRFVYLDSNGNPQELRVCFENVQWYEWSPTASDYVYKYVNVMVLIGLNPDMARRLDGIVDGTPQPCYGQFRMSGALKPDDSDCEWGADNRDAFGGVPANYNLDESQVAVVTAHWRMDQ